MELLLKLNGDKMQGMAIFWPIYFNKEATLEAREIRDELCEYFNTDGQVHLAV